MEGYTFAFFNAGSLGNKFREFKQFITEMRYNLVGVCETWLNSNISDDCVNIPGFKIIRNDRGHRGGGIAIYLDVHIDLKCEVLKTTSSGAIEEVWIKLILSKTTIIFGTLYRPPSGGFPEFLTCFEESLAQFLPDCNHIICGGDVNINMLDSDNCRTKSFLSTIDIYNLKQIVKDPTRIVNKSATLIDVILVPVDNDSYVCGTKTVYNKSDHLLVYCVTKDHVQTLETVVFKARNLNNITQEDVSCLLESAPFQDMLRFAHVDEKVSYFTDLIIMIFDELAPIKKNNKKR